MAMRQTPFAVGEWYHCYGRGIDKRIVYKNRRDYERFLELLYLANSDIPFHYADLDGRDLEEMLKTTRGKSLVAIGAFCLMPNHYHLVLKEVVDGGITMFMRKLGTAYAMYFNELYERSGNVFVKPFRSRHIDTDRYFQHLINYVHCNPAEIYEPNWKSGHVTNIHNLHAKLVAYPYSSLGAFENKKMPVRSLLCKEVFDVVRKIPTEQMLREAKEYYSEHADLP